MNPHIKTNQEFETWNKLKQKIHKSSKGVFAAPGEIRWICCGKNIKTEAVGKGKRFSRPGIILQNFFGNNASIIIPLTSQEKSGSYYFHFIDSNQTKQCAILPQARYIDNARIFSKISTINPKDFKKLKSEYKKLL